MILTLTLNQEECHTTLASLYFCQEALECWPRMLEKRLAELSVRGESRDSPRTDSSAPSAEEYAEAISHLCESLYHTRGVDVWELAKAEFPAYAEELDRLPSAALALRLLELAREQGDRETDMSSCVCPPISSPIPTQNRGDTD